MADSSSAPTEASSSIKTRLILGAVIFVLTLAGVGIYFATKSMPSPNTPSPNTPSPNTPSPNTPSPNTPSPNTKSPNKTPQAVGNLECSSDADCIALNAGPYMSTCNIQNKVCGPPHTPCKVNSDCSIKTGKPFCNQNSKTCVNALDPCMALLGDTWFSSDTYGCVPSCINNDKGRSHSGWCKATSKGECPQDGWDIRSVIGNPDGNHKGGSQESASVCVPVEAKGAPYNWAYDEATQMFVPQCKVTKPFRDEGYCVADSDTDCADGYTKLANYYPHSDSIYICSGKGKNQ